MGLFSKKIGPVILKEDSDAEQFVANMTDLSSRASGALKKEIDQQIRVANAGLAGEKNILFELKNSGIDMYVLHDIYLESGDKGAQIDFLVITRKRFYVLECKNLIGNITVGNDGAFIREFELGGRKIREGIYSPITQNERHRLVIKELRAQEKNLLMKYFFEKNFEKNYIPLVVLANPKTVVNMKYATKEVKSKIIRADQLIETIRQMNAESDAEEMSVSEMESLAQFFLLKNQAARSDYARKYQEMVEQLENTKAPEVKAPEPTKVIQPEDTLADVDADLSTQKLCPRCGSPMVERTATKGDRAGKKFYGCSRFPHCRYIENIEE